MRTRREIKEIEAKKEFLGNGAGKGKSCKGEVIILKVFMKYVGY